MARADTEPRSTAPRRSRPSAIPSRRLAGYAAVTVALLGGIAYAVYATWVRYEPRAARHLPDEAAWAVRLDVEKAPLFDPVRRHLLPLVERAPMLDGIDSTTPALTRALRREAGLNFGLQLREIVVAGTDWRGEGWCIALGGLFPERDLIERIERVLRDRGATGMSKRSDGVLVFQPWGAALGQADDGVLVLGSDPGVLRTALSPSQRYRALGLPRDGSGGAGMLGVPRLATTARAALSPFGWLERTRLVFDLGRDLGVEAHLEGRGGDDSALRREAVEHWLAQPASVSGADGFGLRVLAARAKSRPDKENSVVISTRWTLEELARSMRLLAGALERRLLAARPHAHREGS